MDGLKSSNLSESGGSSTLQGMERRFSDLILPEGVMGSELLSRLAEVERQLSLIRATGHDIAVNAQTHPARTVSVDDHATPNSAELQNVLEADGQTFVGELSMSHGLRDSTGEGRQPAPNASPSNFPDVSPGTSLPRRPDSLLADRGGVRKVRGWLESILDSHGIVANEKEWRVYLQLFLDEIHILYPILHPPTLWEMFEEVWENSVLWPMANAAEREHKRLSVALVCFCLALGRCTVSTRMVDASGVYSSGWSLYSVGMRLMQDVIEMSNSAAKSLLALQIIVLRVSG